MGHSIHAIKCARNITSVFKTRLNFWVEEMIVNQSLPTSYSGLCLCFLYGERRCSQRARPGQGAGATQSFLAPAAGGLISVFQEAGVPS